MSVVAGANEGKASKMICADCGGEMNFHAEKINWSARADAELDLGAEFGEVVEEIHTCPGCAAIATRKAG
jgi:hypothetical protein